MASEPRPRLSIPEYLALERESEMRHEYLHGEMFAMAPPSRFHGILTGNVFGQIWTQLRGRRCEAYQESMRVRTPSGLFAYPDIVALCGEPKLDETDSLLNPVLIVEVLSPSTQRYDRETKFGHYRSIPSLTEFVLVAQDRVHVEHFQRQRNDGWLMTNFDNLAQTLELPSIGCRLDLAEIYERVFPRKD
jgi:Uma2 family endonuclease